MDRQQKKKWLIRQQEKQRLECYHIHFCDNCKHSLKYGAPPPFPQLGVAYFDLDQCYCQQCFFCNKSPCTRCQTKTCVRANKCHNYQRTPLYCKQEMIKMNK